MPDGADVEQLDRFMITWERESVGRMDQPSANQTFDHHIAFIVWARVNPGTEKNWPTVWWNP